MKREQLIMDFIKWTHDKCFTLEGVVDEDIRRMIQIYLKEREHVCYDKEYERWLDDCGSRYCVLTKVSWNEWNNEDACVECPYARDYDDHNEWEDEE